MSADNRRAPLRRTADPLAESIGRFARRPATPDAALTTLAQRLDDRGCAAGRVTAARVDELSRAMDRLEAKLNAIMVAVAATFLSTLLGLAAAVVRSQAGLR